MKEDLSEIPVENIHNPHLVSGGSSGTHTYCLETHGFALGCWGLRLADHPNNNLYRFISSDTQHGLERLRQYIFDNPVPIKERLQRTTEPFETGNGVFPKGDDNLRLWFSEDRSHYKGFRLKPGSKGREGMQLCVRINKEARQALHENMLWKGKSSAPSQLSDGNLNLAHRERISTRSWLGKKTQTPDWGPVQEFSSVKKNIGIHKCRLAAFENNVQDITVIAGRRNGVNYTIFKHEAYHRSRSGSVIGGLFVVAIACDAAQLAVSVAEDQGRFGVNAAVTTAQICGSLTGDVIGAAVGSLFGPIGTFIGRLVGSFIGGALAALFAQLCFPTRWIRYGLVLPLDMDGTSLNEDCDDPGYGRVLSIDMAGTPLSEDCDDPGYGRVLPLDRDGTPLSEDGGEPGCGRVLPLDRDGTPLSEDGGEPGYGRVLPLDTRGNSAGDMQLSGVYPLD